MSKIMVAFAAIGAILVPVLWLGGFEIWAVAAMLFVTTMLVQAACIDLPSVPDYRHLHRLWSKKRPRNDDTTNR